MSIFPSFSVLILITVVLLQCKESIIYHTELAKLEDDFKEEDIVFTLINVKVIKMILLSLTIVTKFFTMSCITVEFLSFEDRYSY